MAKPYDHQKRQTLIATIAGKEYVEEYSSYKQYNGYETHTYWSQHTPISYISSNSGKVHDYASPSSLHGLGNALLKVIETVDKRVNDVYELVVSLEKKLQQHQRDDFLTQHLVERQKLFNELQGQHAELEKQHARLKAEHEKLQEEKNKLDEWKAKLQKQFE